MIPSTFLDPRVRCPVPAALTNIPRTPEWEAFHALSDAGEGSPSSCIRFGWGLIGWDVYAPAALADAVGVLNNAPEIVARDLDEADNSYGVVYLAGFLAVHRAAATATGDLGIPQQDRAAIGLCTYTLDGSQVTRFSMTVAEQGLGALGGQVATAQTMNLESWNPVGGHRPGFYRAPSPGFWTNTGQQVQRRSILREAPPLAGAPGGPPQWNVTVACQVYVYLFGYWGRLDSFPRDFARSQTGIVEALRALRGPARGPGAFSAGLSR